MIGTQESLGVGASNKAMIFVIASPVGPYFPSGFAAVNLLATSDKVRAWPGGTGDAKVGGNYAPCVKPQLDANKEGFQQNLWLFGADHQVTEVGTMNCFVYWKNEKGETELVTPELDGSILPGVTRDSILSLARQWGEFKVSERKFTMTDLVKADKEGRIIEMFGKLLFSFFFSGVEIVLMLLIDQGQHHIGRTFYRPKLSLLLFLFCFDFTSSLFCELTPRMES